MQNGHLIWKIGRMSFSVESPLYINVGWMCLNLSGRPIVCWRASFYSICWRNRKISVHRLPRREQILSWISPYLRYWLWTGNSFTQWCHCTSSGCCDLYLLCTYACRCTFLFTLFTQYKTINFGEQKSSALLHNSQSNSHPPIYIGFLRETELAWRAYVSQLGGW